MKHKLILLFAVLLASPLVAVSQSLDHAVMSFNTFLQNDNQILVRNWNDQYVVSCHSTEKGFFFTCTDHSGFFSGPMGFTSNTWYSDLIPRTQLYNIYDMEILDDTVFFCGSYRKDDTTLWGIVGWFDLLQFNTGIFTPYFLYIPDAFEINKMVVYRNGSQYKIAAVGYNSNVSTPSFSLPYNSTLIEIDDVTGLATTYAWTIDRSSSPKEVIHDVIYTGSQVIFVGIVQQFSDPQYSMRIMDTPASLHTCALGNTIYGFFSDFFEVFAQTHSIQLSHDTIAVAYVHQDTVSGLYETRLRVIDTKVHPPINIASQRFGLDYKDEPIDMAYFPYNNILVMIQRIKYLYIEPQFVFLRPYTPFPYYADIIHFNNSVFYNSMDKYNLNNLVSVGRSKACLQAVPTSSSSISCRDRDNVWVHELPESSVLYMIRTCSWSSCAIRMTRNVLKSYPDIWTFDCGDY